MYLWLVYTSLKSSVLVQCISMLKAIYVEFITFNLSLYVSTQSFHQRHFFFICASSMCTLVSWAWMWAGFQYKNGFCLLSTLCLTWNKAKHTVYALSGIFSRKYCTLCKVWVICGSLWPLVILLFCSSVAAIISFCADRGDAFFNILHVVSCLCAGGFVILFDFVIA